MRVKILALILLSIFFGSFFAPPAVYAVQNTYCVNAQSGLSLRTGPSTDYRRIKVMPYGSQVQVVSQNGLWWTVSSEYGSGYAYSYYLTGCSQSTSTAAPETSTNTVQQQSYVSCQAGVFGNSEMGYFHMIPQPAKRYTYGIGWGEIGRSANGVYLLQPPAQYSSAIASILAAHNDTPAGTLILRLYSSGGSVCVNGQMYTAQPFGIIGRDLTKSENSFRLTAATSYQLNPFVLKTTYIEGPDSIAQDYWVRLIPSG